MNKDVPVITKVEFFSISYTPMKARVSARGFSSLTYRKSGSVYISSADTEFTSTADTLTFIPSGCDYSTEIVNGGEMMILHYYKSEGTPDFFDRPTLITPESTDVFFSLFSRAVSHALSENKCAVMADAYRLFSEISKTLSPARASVPPSLERIKRYIDGSFTLPELRVSELAALYKTSEAYFRREFKKYYLESPIEYIKRRRIEHSCRLLSTELYPITEVAQRSGFDSVSYFSSEFRRYMGCSPREYRNV